MNILAMGFSGGIFPPPLHFPYFRKILPDDEEKSVTGFQPLCLLSASHPKHPSSNLRKLCPTKVSITHLFCMTPVLGLES